MEPLNPYFQNQNYSMNRTPSQPLLGRQIPGKQSFAELIGSRRPMMGLIGQNPNLMPNQMPIGEFSPEQMQNLSPERRTALEQRMGAQVPAQPMIGQPIPGRAVAPAQPNIPMPPPMNQPLQPTERPLPGTGPDFIDVRRPGGLYTMDMVKYIDPATGEIESRSRGFAPTVGSRFVPVDRSQTPNQIPPMMGQPLRPSTPIPPPIPPPMSNPIYPRIQPQPLPPGGENMRGPIFQQLPRALRRQIAKTERKVRRLTGLGKSPDSNSQYMGGSPNFNEQTGAYIS